MNTPPEILGKILDYVVQDNILNLNNLRRVSTSWCRLFQENLMLKPAHEIRTKALRLLNLSQWHLSEESLEVKCWHKNPQLLYSKNNDESEDDDDFYRYLLKELNSIFNGQHDAEIIKYLKMIYPKFFSVEKINAPLYRCAWEYCF